MNWLNWIFGSTPNDVVVPAHLIKILILRNCSYFIPRLLDNKYKLVPDKQWVINNAPRLELYEPEFQDCDNMAAAVYAELCGYCVGMVTVPGHAMNVVILEDETVLYYDAQARRFKNPKDYDVEDMWL